MTNPATTPHAQGSSHPVIALGTFDDGARTEMYVLALDAARQASTIEFYETPGSPDGAKLLRQVPWTVHVPAGAQPFIASSGTRRDQLSTAWIGWTDEAAVHVLSLYHEHPYDLPLAPGDRVVADPVIGASKKLQILVVHAEADWTRIVRYTLSGELDTPVHMTKDYLVTRTAMPLLAASAPIPGSAHDSLVVGFVEASGRDCTVTAFAAIAGTPVHPMTSIPIANLRPITAQRLRLQVRPDAPEKMRAPAAIEAAFVAQRTDREGYAFVHVVFELASSHSQVDTYPISLARDRSIHSARSLLSRFPGVVRLEALVLRDDGALLSWTPSRLALVRSGVPADYEFPIFETTASVYEAIVEGSSVKLVIPTVQQLRNQE
ncbi:MAG TPA: hypothetical protein VHT91_42020 [Kofleriaceae bacterium]|jgi:hypothetical protein|nr:hypothetical protein [Kofleriaceae bacterium]